MLRKISSINILKLYFRTIEILNAEKIQLVKFKINGLADYFGKME